MPARGAPTFLAEIMPPAACLAAPDPACLLAAVETAVSLFERPETGRRKAALRLFLAVEGGVNEPAADALLVRYDPALTPDRLQDIRDKSSRAARSPAEPAASPRVLSDVGTERARIVAIPDRHARVWRANDTIGALIAAGRIEDAEDIVAAVRKSLRPGDAELGEYLAVTSAGAFGAAGAWESWSRSLVAGGFEAKMAAARTESAPGKDPAEIVIGEPLRQGVPLERLLPWIAHAKDRAFRESLLASVLKAAFDRGRAASWKADFDGFRRHLVEATARGDMLRAQPENRFGSPDEALLAFARLEAKARDDRGLALAAALQATLAPVTENSAGARDAARERVLEALIRALRTRPTG